MTKIISIHSFRRGTGKSLVAANVAVLLAAGGKRVAVIDANLLSPSLHIFFRLPEEKIKYSLNDYLSGQCSIEQTAYDVSSPDAEITGRVFLIPSNTGVNEITRILRQGYDVTRFGDGIHELATALELDMVLVDNYAGLSEEILLSIAMSDALVTIMRPDKQDYHGVGVTIEVARKLGVSHIALIVNDLPKAFKYDDIVQQAVRAYQCDQTIIIPHSEEVMAFASSGIFVLSQPDHPITHTLKALVTGLVK